MRIPHQLLDTEWERWDIFDWGRAFFRHYFRSEDSTVPVSRILLDGETFRQVAADPSAAPSMLRHAFRDAVVNRLRRTNRTLCTDALSCEWTTECGHEPPYVAHLMVTCLVASGTGEGATLHDYRRRLNRFLWGQEDNPRYNLNSLPRLWEMLSIWLEKEADAGRATRRLILPVVPPSLRLIGYSVGLAFPSHRDQHRLVELIRDAQLSESPPVLPVIQLVQQNITRFKPRFREAFEEFRTAFLAGDENLFAMPVWSAICEAATMAASGIKSPTQSKGIRARISLEREYDWKFAISVRLDGKPSLPSGLAAVEAEDIANEEFRYLLACESPDQRSIGDWMLSSESAGQVAGLCGMAVARLVSEGALLFIPNEDGDFQLTKCLPASGEIRALVRDDIAMLLRASLESIGAGVRVRPSRYRGWRELDNFNANDLSRVDLGEDYGIGVFQQTIDAPAVSFRNGVRVPQGWLGWRRLLPEIHLSHPSDSVTIAARVDPDATMAVQAEHHPHDPLVFSFPDSPSLPHHLDGEFVVRAVSDGRSIATKTIHFRKACIATEFRSISRPEHWFSESGVVDTAPLQKDDNAGTEIGVVPYQEGSVLRFGSISLPENASEVPDVVQSLAEALSAIFMNRQVLGSGETFDIFRRSLELGGAAAWDAIRAWEEAGILQGVNYRRWRRKGYTARPPRFMICRRGGLLFGVLQGLASSAVEEAAARGAVENGWQVTRLPPSCSIAPVPLVITGGDFSSLADVSRIACLAAPQLLTPLEKCLSSVKEVRLIQSELRANHVLESYWNWESGSFSANSPNGEVAIEWYRKDDAPDAYVVRADGGFGWHTLSRTWAILVASSLRRKSPPFMQSSSAALERVVRGCHLPISVGLWTTAASGISPGPQDTETAYSYSFPEPGSCQKAWTILWGQSVPADLIAEGHQIERQARSMHRDERSVAIPIGVRHVVREKADALGLRYLAYASVVPRRLLPRLVRYAGRLTRLES